MTQDQKKQAAANAALEYIEDNTFIGIGTGSTVNFLIEKLATIKHRLAGVVASSKATEARLRSLQIPLFDLNAVPELSLYIDSADAYNPYCQLVKGKGGALAREKVLAAASQKFICIVDDTKQTQIFGECPVPVEVLPIARGFVARSIVKLKGEPIYRSGFLTDNGNIILDIHRWSIAEPIKLEQTLNNIPGIIANGLFANYPADRLLVSTSNGIQVIQNNSPISTSKF